jgi:hypothetical protein
VREEGNAVANTTRTLLLGLVMAAVLMVDGVEVTGQQPPANREAPVPGPRIRTEDPVLTMLIEDATDRSPTFRRLVAAIQTTDGVVYVERGRCGHIVRTCLLYWMTVAGPYRLLRVVVDERKGGTEAAASIAHELQHALEVLHHRRVRSAAEMHGLFERIGTWQGNAFETRAAIDAQKAVRSELTTRRAGREP